MNKAQNAVSLLARRAVTQAKAIKPVRGGDHHGHVPYEKACFNHNHPGNTGLNYGTGYFPVGETAGRRAAIGGGLVGIVVVGVGACVWSAWRQGQWS